MNILEPQEDKQELLERPSQRISKPSHQFKQTEKQVIAVPHGTDNRSNYYLTDFFTNYDDVSSRFRVMSTSRKAQQQLTNQAQTKLHYSTFRTWVYYCLVGVFTALLSFGIDFFSTKLFLHRIFNINQDNPLYLQVILFVASAITLASIATILCHALAVEAQGAGTAEVKCILTGARMTTFLQFKVLAAKVLGLTSALAAGYHVGKCGPNIHIGAMVAYNLFRLKYFKCIKKDSVFKVQSVMVGAGTGMGLTFNAPIGGFVAGIEIIGKVYSLRTLWILFVTTFVANLVLKVFQEFGFGFWFYKVQQSYVQYCSWDFLSFAGLGIVCGMYSALFIHLSITFQMYKNKLTSSFFFRQRYSYIFIGIIIISLMQFYIPCLQYTTKELINNFFQGEIVDNKWKIYDNENDNLSYIYSILIILLMRSLIFFIGMTSPIPAGVFGPFMFLGCILGRLYGETLHYFFPSVVSLGRFAIAGAAAVSATTTRFLAMAVCVMEMTQDLEQAFPIMIATIFSFAVGHTLSKSYFYSTIELKKYVYAQKLMKDEIYQLKAKEIMQKPQIILNQNSTLGDIFQHLLNAESFCIADYLPVIISGEQQELLGIVRTENLIKYFRDELKMFRKEENEGEILEWQVKLDIVSEIASFLDEEAVVNGQIIKRKANKVLQKMQIPEVQIRQSIFRFHGQRGKEMTLPTTIQKEIDFQELENMQNNAEKNQFLSRIINFKDPVLALNNAPVIINQETNGVKIHYLFISLQISSIYVVDKGIIQGVIKKQQFLELNQ